MALCILSSKICKKQQKNHSNNKLTKYPQQTTVDGVELNGANALADANILG